MHEAARPATSTDAEVLGRLFSEFVAEQAAHRGGQAWLDEQGSAPTPLPIPSVSGPRAVFVGSIDDVVVGFAVVEAADTPAGTRVGRVRSLYVEPEARAVGVGEVLLDAIVDWCRRSGCGAVDAPAFPGARQMKNFFEAHGFVARLLVMQHVIADLDSGA